MNETNLAVQPQKPAMQMQPDNVEIVEAFQTIGDLFQQGLDAIKKQGEALHLNFSQLFERIATIEIKQESTATASQQRANARDLEIENLCKRIDQLEFLKRILNEKIAEKEKAQATSRNDLASLIKMKEVENQLLKESDGKLNQIKKSCETNLGIIDKNLGVINAQVGKEQGHANQLQQELNKRRNEAQLLENGHTGHVHSFSYNLDGLLVPGECNSSGPNK